MNSQQAAAEYWRTHSELKVIQAAMENHIRRATDQGVQDILTCLVDGIINVELEKKKHGENFPDLNKTISQIEDIEVPIVVDLPECMRDQA